MPTSEIQQLSFERIPQKSIQTFLRQQINNHVLSFADLKSTYRRGEDLSQYRMHEAIFHLPYAIDRVWYRYMNADPNLVWNGRMINFALMVSKADGKIMYQNEPYAGAQVGQVFYLDLSIFGLVHVPVAHEIIEICPKQMHFELSYVEGCKSFGKQRIAFIKEERDRTRIVHTTHYRSDSPFRDRYVYPFFHTKAIREYHNNMHQSFP